MLLLVFVLLPGLIFADREITLTNDSASYVAYGEKLLNYQTLTVSLNCTDCQIYVEFEVSDVNNTIFSFTSPTKNYTYDQVTSSVWFIIPGPISLLTSLGVNGTTPTFLASFRLWNGVNGETDWQPTNLQLIPGQNGAMNTVRLENGIRSVTLVMGRASYANVKLFAPTVSPNCSISVLAGHIPSYSARDRLKIYEFTNDNIPMYQSSYVRTSAFTLLIQENCTARIMYSVLDKATIIVDSYQPSNGFSMSYEYLEPFGETENFTESMGHTGISLNETYPFLPIVFTVKDAMLSNGGYLNFQTTDYSGNQMAASNVSTSISGYILGDMWGQTFKIIWNPSTTQQKKGYLVWYMIRNETMSTTSTSTVQSSIGTMTTTTTLSTTTTTMRTASTSNVTTQTSATVPSSTNTAMTVSITIPISPVTSNETTPTALPAAGRKGERVMIPKCTGIWLKGSARIWQKAARISLEMEK
ncbi:unnamed protein product, partial [Mesorhabditis belari]|uniref:Uncharacterized protein n=1 Tax=Mesorhabditis belari TaxID=2138241 RepID=A0AAF3EC66_9BILA